MISLTTNTRGKTFMNDSTEGEKTETPLAEIVSGYNKLAEQLGLKPVKRFKDRESAIRRFTELKAKADAPKEELSAEDAALLAKINDAVKQMNDAEQKLNDAEQKLNADKPKEKKLSATKKATAPKKAKKVAATKKVVKAPKEDNRSKIAAEFDLRAGSLKEKLINLFGSHKGKFVSQKECLKTLYGSQAEENKGAFSMCLQGLMKKVGKLPYKFDKRKDEDGLAYGLFAK